MSWLMAFPTRPIPWLDPRVLNLPALLNFPQLLTCNITHLSVCGMGQCLFQLRLQSDLLLCWDFLLRLNIGFPWWEDGWLRQRSFLL